MIDREELERLHKAATPAPWTAHPVRGYAFDEVFHRTGAGELLCVCADHQIDYRDAPLIAHLRNAVPDILNLLTERDTLSAENARLEEANRTIAAECIKWAREAGEAKGKLEGSEAAGVVDQWREKCEQLEAENAKLREGLEVAVETMGKAKAEFLSSTKTPTQCAYMMNAHLNAGLSRINDTRAALKGEEG